MGFTATTSITNTITTDAQFRAWASAYDAKFTSFGWVNNHDVGEINLATVTTPGVTNTPGGFQIWKFNDALQASAPIFVKIEYGSGTLASQGSLWITLGSGSNGSGTLNGILSTRQQIQCTANAGTITHYWSGDTNRCTIAVNGASAGASMYVSVERTVDSTGAVISEGALLIYRGTSAWGQQAWNQVTGPYTATWETTLGAMGAAVAPFGTFGAVIAIYPIFHNKGVFLSPGLNAFIYENPLVTQGSTVSFTVYGASHTYMPLGSPNFGSVGRGGFSTPSLMMRYE